MNCVAKKIKIGIQKSLILPAETELCNVICLFFEIVFALTSLNLSFVIPKLFTIVYAF